MPDLSDDIETAATSPVSATADGVSVTQRSIEEMIAADRHLKSDDGVEQPHRGLRITRLLPPGAR